MTSLWIRPRLRSALVSVAAIGALAGLAGLAGCSSKSSTSTSSTTTGGSGSSTTTGSGGSDQLDALASAVRSGKQATFKAVYSISGSGAGGPVTLEQKPPKTLFKTGAAEVIGTGTATYYCSTAGTPTCLTAGTANPLAGLTQLFNPDSIVGVIHQAQAQVAAHSAGYDVSFSTQSFAGVDANCVTVSGQGQTGKYCVTKTGILAYSGTAASSFELTSYSSSVSDSDFTLPAGATTVTTP